jgi:hypothetical protein
MIDPQEEGTIESPEREHIPGLLHLRSAPSPALPLRFARGRTITFLCGFWARYARAKTTQLNSPLPGHGKGG